MVLPLWLLTNNVWEKSFWRKFLEVISVGGTPTGLCARSWGGGAPPGTVCKRVTTVFKAEIWDRDRGFVYIGLKLIWFEKKTSYQQHPGGKFLAVDRTGLTWKWNYCGFPSMTSYQQRLGGKFLAVDRRGNKHENQIIVGFPLWIFAPAVWREGFGVEIVVLYFLA